jgi:predicted transcriptional regulator
MKEVTIKEIETEHGLTGPEANGLIKSLVRLGFANKVGERKSQHKTGKGRPGAVYEIQEEITLRL